MGISSADIADDSPVISSDPAPAPAHVSVPADHVPGTASATATDSVDALCAQLIGSLRDEIAHWDQVLD